MQAGNGKVLRIWSLLDGANVLEQECDHEVHMQKQHVLRHCCSHLLGGYQQEFIQNKAADKGHNNQDKTEVTCAGEHLICRHQHRMIWQAAQAGTRNNGHSCLRSFPGSWQGASWVRDPSCTPARSQRCCSRGSSKGECPRPPPLSARLKPCEPLGVPLTIATAKVCV